MKIESQFPFLPSTGSLSSQESSRLGSLSYLPTSSPGSTTFYTLGGRRRDHRNGSAGSADILIFPPSHQVAKVQEVAAKLHRCKTQRHRDYYTMQVSQAITNRLARLGIPIESRIREIEQFWQRVNAGTPDQYVQFTETGVRIVDKNGWSATSGPSGWHFVGDIIVDGDVIADGISLKTHVHGGIVRGGAETDPPSG